MNTLRETMRMKDEDVIKKDVADLKAFSFFLITFPGLQCSDSQEVTRGVELRNEERVCHNGGHLRQFILHFIIERRHLIDEAGPPDTDQAQPLSTQG